MGTIREKNKNHQTFLWNEIIRLKNFLKTKCSYGTKVQKLIAEIRIFIWRIPFKCIVRKIAGFCSIGTTGL